MVGTCRLIQEIESLDRLEYAHTSAVVAWTPIFVPAFGVLVPMRSADANVIVTFYRAGAFNFKIASAVTVIKGDILYYNVTNGNVQLTNPEGSGFLLGQAITAGSAVAGYVDVQIFTGNVSVSDQIVVYGSDGKYKAAYQTIDLAIAAMVANDELRIKSGEYNLTAACNITVPGIKIIGDGNVTINGAANAAYCFKTVFGVLSATASLTFKNITINHDVAGTTKATMVGLWILNTGATKKINVYLDDVEFESSGGISIDQDHADTSNAIRVYCNRCTTEGPVDLVCANDGDRFRFFYGNLRGGLVSDAGNYDAEITIAWSTFLLNGITGGHSNQRVIFIASVSETDADPDVYLEAVAGDVQTQTPQVIAFDAP